jgi:hypothetical protein
MCGNGIRCLAKFIADLEGWGTRDWGLGLGEESSKVPNPQSLIPNPQSPITYRIHTWLVS